MIIKEADDRSGDVEVLEELLRRTDVSGDTRRRIEVELRQLRAGIAGERQAAYLIDFDIAASRNWAVIHDLRLEVNGRVAQIDHLVMDRLLDIWVCESKHFSEGVAVDEHGEWVTFYGRKAVAIPSPLEQNRRHVAVLEDVLASGEVDLPKRFGLLTIRPRVHSLVLVSDSARISRPPKSAWGRIPGIETVIKVERHHETMSRQFDEQSATAMAKVVGPDTLERVARSLASLHRPASFDYAARFGLAPMEPTVDTPPAALTPSSQPARPIPEPVGSPAAATMCVSCGRAVSAAVVAYCATHRDRFDGLTYCYDCQRKVRRSASRTA